MSSEANDGDNWDMSVCTSKEVQGFRWICNRMGSGSLTHLSIFLLRHLLYDLLLGRTKPNTP